MAITIEMMQSSQTDLAALQTQRDDDRIATLDANHPRMEAECKLHSAERKNFGGQNGHHK